MEWFKKLCAALGGELDEKEDTAMGRVLSCRLPRPATIEVKHTRGEDFTIRSRDVEERVGEENITVWQFSDAETVLITTSEPWNPTFRAKVKAKRVDYYPDIFGGTIHLFGEKVE